LKKITIRFNAPVVLSFALLSLLVLILDGILGGILTTRYFCLFHSPLSQPLTYVRFFTHVLGHANYSHYMGNMLLLLLVGPAVEDRYGSRSTLWFILGTALITGLVHYFLFPGGGLMGASGIVFMFIVLSSFTETKKGTIPVTLILVVFFYLGGEILDGITAHDNVSQITHVVGGLCGLLFGFTVQGRKK
jgi:membrane associated rhomboid family serine protease